MFKGSEWHLCLGQLGAFEGSPLGSPWGTGEAWAMNLSREPPRKWLVLQWLTLIAIHTHLLARHCSADPDFGSPGTV